MTTPAHARTRDVSPARALEDAIERAFSTGGDTMVWRHPTGMGVVRGHHMRFGLVGSSDLVGVCRGRFLAIEVKVGRDRQRPEQAAFQRAIEKAGGLYIIATCVDDVARALVGIP